MSLALVLTPPLFGLSFLVTITTIGAPQRAWILVVG